jgi:hypothetical protein
MNQSIGYRNRDQARGATVTFGFIKEFFPFLHFANSWRDYPSPVVGSLLFVTFWMYFAGGVENPRYNGPQISDRQIRWYSAT